MKIAISGYYGFNNTGDEAILLALRKGFAGHELLVLDAKNRFNLKYLWETEAVISGGGGLLQDKTSVRSFLYYAGVLLIAKLLGKKTYILAQSIGPIKNPFDLMLLKWVLNRVNGISVRDKASLEFIRSLGISKLEIILTADPCFILESESSPAQENYGPVIGISPRKFIGMPQDLGVNLARVCDALHERLQAKIVFIPFQLTEDLSFCRNIAGMMKSPAKVWEGSHDPLVVMQKIAGLNALVAARLHALIFAVNALVPALGIAYDPKVSAFMWEADLSSLAPESLKDIDNLVKTMEDILKRQKDYKRQLKEKRDLFRQRAQLNFEVLTSPTPDVIGGPPSPLSWRG